MFQQLQVTRKGSRNCGRLFVIIPLIYYTDRGRLFGSDNTNRINQHTEGQQTLPMAYQHVEQHILGSCCFVSTAARRDWSQPITDWDGPPPGPSHTRCNLLPLHLCLQQWLPPCTPVTGTREQTAGISNITCSSFIYGETFSLKWHIDTYSIIHTHAHCNTTQVQNP